MEEAQFYYYSTLAKYSITNNFFIFIFLIMEITPILLDCIFNPFLIQFYYKKYEISYSSSIIELKSHEFKKITIYYWYRELRDSNNSYPIRILIRTLVLYFLILFFFILFCWYENMSKIIQVLKIIKKDYKILNSFKIIFLIYMNEYLFIEFVQYYLLYFNIFYVIHQIILI